MHVDYSSMLDTGDDQTAQNETSTQQSSHIRIATAEEVLEAESSSSDKQLTVIQDETRGTFS